MDRSAENIVEKKLFSELFNAKFQKNSRLQHVIFAIENILYITKQPVLMV